MFEENLPKQLWNSQTIFTYNHWLGALVKGKCSSSKPTRLATGSSVSSWCRTKKWPTISCQELNCRPIAPRELYQCATLLRWGCIIILIERVWSALHTSSLSPNFLSLRITSFSWQISFMCIIICHYHSWLKPSILDDTKRRWWPKSIHKCCIHGCKYTFFSHHFVWCWWFKFKPRDCVFHSLLAPFPSLLWKC